MTERRKRINENIVDKNLPIINTYMLYSCCEYSSNIAEEDGSVALVRDTFTYGTGLNCIYVYTILFYVSDSRANL